jgi:hypothetical protein
MFPPPPRRAAAADVASVSTPIPTSTATPLKRILRVTSLDGMEASSLAGL